jgi:hypothetical protein
MTYSAGNVRISQWIDPEELLRSFNIAFGPQLLSALLYWLLQYERPIPNKLTPSSKIADRTRRSGGDYNDQTVYSDQRNIGSKIVNGLIRCDLSRICDRTYDRDLQILIKSCLPFVKVSP